MLIDQILEVHSAPDWLIEAEVVTIRRLLDTHCRWNLRWVSRDCNVLAHNLANWGLYSGMLWFSIVMRCRMIYLVVTALPGSAERICNGNPCLLGKRKKSTTHSLLPISADELKDIAGCFLTSPSRQSIYGRELGIKYKSWLASLITIFGFSFIKKAK